MTPARIAVRRPVSGASRAIAAIIAGALLILGGHAVQGADITRGSALYTKYCVNCHGANGIAVFPGAPSFARMERLMQPDPALLNSVKFGKRSMPAFAATLKDQEILDIIAYIRTIR